MSTAFNPNSICGVRGQRIAAHSEQPSRIRVKDFAKQLLSRRFGTGHDFSHAGKGDQKKGALAPAIAGKRRNQAGLTLVELIVTCAILGVLASAAVPMARFKIQREKERELRYDLWQMRDAIDHYKDAADKGAFQTKVDSQNYPPDLEELVKGVDIQGKKVKFLRKIPIDPMSGKAEWGLHSMQDDPTSDSYGGQSVFDVYSKSTGTALDGTKYSEW